MSPELKIILYVAFIISLFLIQNLTVYAFILVAITILLLRIPVASLKRGWVPISVFLVFTFVSNIFFSHGKILYSFGSIVFTEEGLRIASVRTTRIFFMVAGAKILTATTPLDVLVGARGNTLKPLEKIGLPVGEFSSVMSLTLKCFPGLKDYLTENYKNLKEKGELRGFLGKTKVISSFLLPMFVESMQSPERFFRDELKNENPK